jgi:hypothetical protein
MLASGDATPSPLRRRTLRIRWTTAVLACVASAALGAAAYRLGVRERNVELRSLSIDTQVAVPAASSSAVSGPPTRLRPKWMPRTDWRKRARR